MYLERRKVGNKVKYYLARSYRDEKNTVRKIRRYLGADLSPRELEKLRPQAEEGILLQIKEMKTDVFEFSLTGKEIQQLNRYDAKIEVRHLNRMEWERFTEDFVYDTNAIEGSTVLRDEIPDILEKEKPKDSEERETKGVAKAIHYIRTTKEDVSKRLLLDLHRLCFQGSKEFAGRFRDVEVVIGNQWGEVIHRGVPVAELHEYLDELISWYKKNRKRFKPLVMAALMHDQFEHIHPFRDGNGRVGRLLLNFVLLKSGYPPINIFLEDRAEYYQALQRYSNDHDVKPTLRFLIGQYNKTLKKVTTKKKG